MSSIPITTIEEFKNKIQSCRELKIPREGFGYSHHVFVGEADENGCDIYHYTLNSELSVRKFPSGKIKKVRLEYETYDTSSEIHKIFNFHKNDKVYIVHRHDYPQTIADENVCIERANSRIDEEEYTVSFNNCECYVNWIFTNDNTSQQSRESCSKYLKALVVDNTTYFFKHELPWVLSELNSWMKRMFGKLDEFFKLNLEQKWNDFIDVMQNNNRDNPGRLYSYLYTREFCTADAKEWYDDVMLTVLNVIKVCLSKYQNKEQKAQYISRIICSTAFKILGKIIMQESNPFWVPGHFMGAFIGSLIGACIGEAAFFCGNYIVQLV